MYAFSCAFRFCNAILQITVDTKSLPRYAFSRGSPLYSCAAGLFGIPGSLLLSFVSAAIYQHLLSDRKFGLTYNLLASKIMPTLIPLSVCPGLSIDQVGGSDLSPVYLASL